MASEPVQQIRADGVEQMVFGEFEGIDGGEARLRAVHLGKGHRAMESHDRAGGQRCELVVQGGQVTHDLVEILRRLGVVGLIDAEQVLLHHDSSSARR
ncbi:hypothetical protein [Nocardia otitidiscaviarum]|uniref:hypothetical protein n=1 Tax=Nocardia otitidiscaviarum TaxID=1823 RepID=UPI00313BA02B